jgi:hypothetical protein
VGTVPILLARPGLGVDMVKVEPSQSLMLVLVDSFLLPPQVEWLHVSGLSGQCSFFLNMLSTLILYY